MADNSQNDQKEVVVCALYHFVNIDDYQALQQSLLSLLKDNGVKGTLLVAAEGINGTVASTSAGVKATEWNELISDPEVTVIDTRNEYEVLIGTFKNAINPHTESFREFPGFAESELNPNRHKKIAMFCTGGIRCEKSTAFLKSKGFDEVYHLEGGILKYLEDVPKEESLWQGECFVFDDRVTVDHDLKPGSYDQCHACRMPISDTDKKSNAYVRGVSCSHCIDSKTDADRARFRERQKQIHLANERGEDHIGGDASSAQAQRARLKKEAREAQRKKTEQGNPEQ